MKIPIGKWLHTDIPEQKIRGFFLPEVKYRAESILLRPNYANLRLYAQLLDINDFWELQLSVGSSKLVV